MDQFIVEASIAVIALAALGVAVWEGWENRKHNRLSVKPYSCFYVGLPPSLHEPPGLTLKNNGAGPAIITHFEILVDGVPIEGTGFSKWKRALELVGLSPDWVYCRYPEAGTSLAAGESLALLICEPGSASTDKQATLGRALQRLQTSITYESIYGERFSDMSGLVRPERTAALLA
jgi:hypothetical protein